MFRIRTLSMLVGVGVALALPALVLADTDNESPEDEEMNPAMQETSAPPRTDAFTPQLQKVNTLIGTALQNAKEENLGRIEDIVLNSNRDRAAYVIVSSGGVLGMGEKYCAVPWSRVELKKEGKACVLNIDKERFNKAPRFTKSKWPDMNSPQWVHEVHQFFHDSRGGQTTERHEAERAQEGTAGTEQERFWGVRHSRLIGTDVKNRQGENLGAIEDIVIDTHMGDVAYGILSFGGVLGMGEKYCAVPWTAIELRPTQRIARLESDRKTIESIAFKPSEWPNLADATYARNIYSRFDREPYWEVFGYVGSEKGGRPDAAWLAGSEYNKCFDTTSMETMEGTVESVGTFRPEPGALEGLRLRVKTNEGNVVTVYVGPECYCNKSGMTFHNGDRVKFTGSKTTVNERSVVMASEIQRGDQRLQLRDKQGEPKWTAEDLRMR